MRLDSEVAKVAELFSGREVFFGGKKKRGGEKKENTTTPPQTQPKTKETFWQRMWLKAFHNYPLCWTTLANFLAFGRGTILSELFQSVILLWVDPKVNSVSNHLKKVTWEIFFFFFLSVQSVCWLHYVDLREDLQWSTMFSRPVNLSVSM